MSLLPGLLARMSEIKRPDISGNWKCRQPTRSVKDDRVAIGAA
ncbi:MULTISPECIES: hypothetical protein [unclassified Endozoicomonas]